MQKQQQKANIILNEQKSQITAFKQTTMMRPFANPVCQQTYNSLPRIYGRKKKKTKIQTSPGRQQANRDDKIISKTRHYFSANQDTSNSKVKKIKHAELTVRLSKPMHAAKCSKKACVCHQHEQQDSDKKSRARNSSTNVKRYALPQIRKFQLEDLESQYKVTMQGLATSINFGMSGLQRIIEQNEGLKSSKASWNATKDRQSAQGEKNKNSKKNNLKDLKHKYKFKPKFNSTRFQIQQQSQQEKITDEHQDQDIKNSKKNRKDSARYKTQMNDSESPKSSNSISLTSFIFRGTKRQNTNFHDLSLSQKSLDKNKMSRKPSQLSNGLFRIPQQPQYIDYLKGYRNVGEGFNIKALVKRPRFKVAKSDKGVYFGEMDEQSRRHGQGINVTEKQIFEGKYEKDVKTQGCQRNIDGVYIGGFLKGQRSGHGIFKWNNGQTFEGNWQKGMKNGFGVWKSPKGDYYEGQWQQNRQHGEGLFKHRNSTYKGEFKNFLKDGRGQQNFANGDKYVGQYKEGKPHGKGRYQWKDGGYYQGQFIKGMREGKGKWVDQNGTVYEGYFKKDFKHGFGRQTYKSGEKYEGQFFEGTRTKGKIYDKNDNFIEVKGK